MRGKQDERTFATMLALQGNDPANLRRDLRRALVFEKITKKLGESIVVTDRDIRLKYEEQKAAYYPEQVKARQIIVLTEDLARRLYKQIKEGADFAELARTTSTERSSRENGGDLGWVLRGTGHYPPWDDIVFKMKPGEISEPFQTVHGWHIVKVEGYRPVGWGRLEDKRDAIVSIIKKQRAYDEMQRRVEELKKKADLWVADRIELDAPAAALNTKKGQ
ncbi:peptidylprolyl isomerase [Nitrospira sp. Kam-Ns4a]